MKNLIQRTISGIIFIAIVIGSILWNQYSFGVAFAIITALSLYEFHKLTNHQEHVEVNTVCSIIGGLLIFTCSYLYATSIFPFQIYLVYGLYLVFTFIAELYRKKEQPLHNWSYLLLGQIFIAIPFSLLNFILFTPVYQPLMLIALFVTIWVNDTGAYIVGVTSSKFGNHRLFERISPKKSWEGFIGGAIFALLSGYIFSLFITELSLLQWLIFSEIIVIFGTFGDLIESLMKRTLHVKDSGNIIPGHGGILDRFDSMLLAAPMIFIYLTILSLF
ncbi:phosphatidate cytidylyltransferase [Paludibacteraceae bacterium OttesenSCG-928-F17]|nr:phosphatidate cytidylyltransferase [Paludibacteraceae bacterium OttesenSCG-928-F17]